MSRAWFAVLIAAGATALIGAGSQSVAGQTFRQTAPCLGVYSGKLVAPYEALYAGLADQKIVTTLCPGGKERMRRLMAMIANRRVDLTPLITHRFGLDEIETALDLFSHQRDGVLKVALYPGGIARALAIEPATVGALDEQC